MWQSFLSLWGMSLINVGEVSNLADVENKKLTNWQLLINKIDKMSVRKLKFGKF